MADSLSPEVKELALFIFPMNNHLHTPQEAFSQAIGIAEQLLECTCPLDHKNPCLLMTLSQHGFDNLHQLEIIKKVKSFARI